MRFHRTTLIAVLLVLLLAADAAATIRVSSAREFARAVDRIGNRAGTVVLERGRYGKLVVRDRGPRARWLTVRARRGAVTKHVVVARSSRVRLVGLRVTNYWGGAGLLYVTRSSRVKLERVSVAGRPGNVARVRVWRSGIVSVKGSELSACGEGAACLGLRSSVNVTVSGNVFRDCAGCDFVGISRVNGMRLAGNQFDRALPGPCMGPTTTADAELASATDPPGCNHQDLVQVVGATNLTIEGNRFGAYDYGAAQLYISGQYGADNIVIRGNHFLAADPAVPGLVPVNGLIVGNPPGFRGLPSRVLIEGNTIESGAVRDPGRYRYWPGVANSLIVSEGYLDWPLEERPIVVGNTFAAMSAPELVCGTAQVGPNQGC